MDDALDRALSVFSEFDDVEMLKLITQAEAAFTQWTGMPFTILNTSGLTSLTTALYAAGVVPSDEVVCDAIFPFSIMATLSLGASPVLADLDPKTLTMSAESLGKILTPRTRAVVATCVFGIPPDTAGLRDVLADYPNVTLIEDHAQAFGVTIEGAPAAARPDISCFSFHIDKPLTVGYGGAVVCRSREVDIAARRFINLGWYPRTTAEGQTDWEGSWRSRSAICQSARVPPIVAGLLLKRLQCFAERRRDHVESVKTVEEILSVTGLTLQSVPKGFNGQRWRVAGLAESPDLAKQLVQSLRICGSRAYQYEHPPASQWPGLKRPEFNELPHTIDILDRLIAFPVMNPEDGRMECEAIERMMR